MGSEREIRCPVHGFIRLGPRETGIIGTSAFQRLRSIRQLALANLVYPGATHTRFEHSLGTYHIAGLIAERLRLSRGERRLVLLAALVHDLGHGPFSHVSEEVLERYVDFDSLPLHARSGTEIHEWITCDILLHDVEVKKCIPKTDRERIVELLSGISQEPVLRDIVSGPLDADKQDYLLRDSLFCGVQYGIFDLAQLHRSFTIDAQDPENNRSLMIDPEGVHALEQFILAKYYLTTQVYRHRVRLITDQMLVRAIVLGIEEDGIEELRKLYAYDSHPTFCSQYLKWNDARVLLTYTHDHYAGKRCHNLLNRLKARELLKQVFEERLTKETPKDGIVRDHLATLAKASTGSKEWEEKQIALTRTEQELADAISNVLGTQPREHFEIDHNLVILNVYTIKSVRAPSGDDGRPILVREVARPVDLKERSTLFRSIGEASDDTFVEVYAPIGDVNQAEKDKIREAVMMVLHKRPKEG